LPDTRVVGVFFEPTLEQIKENPLEGMRLLLGILIIFKEIIHTQFITGIFTLGNYQSQE
jgi:hypothetical protein